VNLRLAAVGLLAALASGACSEQSIRVDRSAAAAIDPSEAAERGRVEPLRVFERDLRARLDPRTLPSSEVMLGADPWSIKALPRVEARETVRSRARFVGILRGRSAIVLLDDDLEEIARAPAPRSTTGLAVLPSGAIATVGELSNEIVFFAVEHDALRRTGAVRTPAEGLRDVVGGPDGTLAALDPRGTRVHFLSASAVARGARGAATANGEPISVPTCGGAAQLERTRNALLVTCVIEHAIDVFPIVAGAPVAARQVRLTNDGPFFTVAAREEEGDQLTVVAGGLEDHALDRTRGSFGFIDSFIHVFNVSLAKRESTRVRSVNVSELGVVTPKVIEFVSAGAVRVSGYGTSDLVTINLADGKEQGRVGLLPGTRTIERAATRAVLADPLLDAWIVLDAHGPRVVPVADPGVPARSALSRLGEATVFTTIIAPWNKTDERLSRFTCETCHFEGTIDGRTHHTGRADIRATTKPILGLFNNRPHFSRALDADLAILSMNEFRVSNAKSGHDPFFSLEAVQAPWLTYLGVSTYPVPPEELRRAFMAFLAEFTHRPNVRVIGRKAFSTEERRGAEAFRERCEHCHQAKFAADATDADGPRVPYADWERYVFEPEGRLVWGDAHYEKTGIVPYVNERGARVPSLRRIYAKRPYFTNGSAADLSAVLDRARIQGGAFLHADANAATGGLPVDEQRAIRAFLETL
jgi:hypothetical protein